jgi:MFS transporter, DHA3 family, macrolide efflux protein
MDEMPVTEPCSDSPGAIDVATGTDWRRSLALLWLGQVISHLGDALFLVGVFFLALEVTGSKAASGLLVAMNFLPALALGLFAGAFVDRHDRRRMMIAADLLRAIAVGSIPVLHATGHLTALPLAVAMFSLATGTTIFNPALKALLPELTPPAHLTRTVAFFQISEYGALVLGPVLAALILPRVPTIHLFTVDSITFVFSALSMALLPRQGRAALVSPAVARARDILAEVGAGLVMVRENRVLTAVLILSALDNVIMMGLAHVGIPLLVKETLGLGPDAYARAQSFFFFGLAASSAGMWLFARGLPKGPLILIGVILDGLTFVPLAFCHTLFQVQAALFIHAMAIPLIIIPRTVLIQQLVPGALHGRIFALVNVTVFGMTAISSGLSGLLAESIAPQTLFLVLGIGGALVGLGGFAVPALRSTR